MKLLPDSFLRTRWLAALGKLELGVLDFTTPEGEMLTFKGKQPGPHADFRIRSWDVIRHMALRGDIGLGEDYIAGLWETEDLERLFSLFLTNMDALRRFADGHPFVRNLLSFYTRWLRRNNRRGSKLNIKAHYDVGNDFYRLWLDETMTYSSALFDTTDDLAEAQRTKYRRILGKVEKDKASILEIGCGWGGFAAEAAAKGHTTTGITISPAQHAYATTRLEGKADIRLQDYRDTKGLFDMIVSIEMFEAVGVQYWPKYFQTIRDRLKQGGMAVVQTIVIRDEHFEEYRKCSDFIRHYVFPGGMLPSTLRFHEEAMKAGLRIREVFAFGPDYARTLREWLKRFDDRREEVLAMGYSETFIRNWRFYLSICAAAFAVGRTDVVQVELSHA